LGLLQNELLPRDWERHGIDEPTIISVWFEKKPGQDAKVLIPSPIYGPHAGLIEAALETLSIPTRLLERREDMVFELVRKNIYILTTNVCGLEVGGTVGRLWQDHRELATAVANEVLELQASLCGMHLPSQAMMESVVEALRADPEHKCMGRSAPQRLRRALEQADTLGLAVKQLRTIERKSSSAQA
jgi:ketopantoate reductase